MMQRSFSVAMTACLLCGCSWWLVQRPATLISAADGTKAEVKVQILDWPATQKLIAAKKGKIVVLDAWSTSCIPCIKEFPNLVALQKSHKDDVVCVSLNLDYIGLKAKPPEFYQERVLKFLAKQEAAFDNVLCSEEAEQMFEKLEIPSIPAVFVYGRDGKLVKTFDNSDAKTEADGFTYKDVTALVDELRKK
jgi:thiol-disulfide isomerase/thioredoxin